MIASVVDLLFIFVEQILGSGRWAFPMKTIVDPLFEHSRISGGNLLSSEAIIDDDSQFVRVCKRFNEELGEWFFGRRNCLDIILLEAVPDGKFYAYV